MARKDYIILPGFFVEKDGRHQNGLDITKTIRTIMQECGYPCDPCVDDCLQPNICDLLTDCNLGGGATTFIGLTDTPNNFGDGNPLDLVRINAAGDALEFVDPGVIGGASTFLGLTDTPGAFAGAGQVAIINGTNNAIVFDTIDNILSGSGAILSASNGLTEAANNVKLGGTLIENTSIDVATFDLLFGTGALNSGHKAAGPLYGHSTPFWHGESTDGDAVLNIELDQFSTNIVRWVLRTVDTSLTEQANLVVTSDGTISATVQNTGAGTQSDMIVIDSNAFLRCQAPTGNLLVEAREGYVNINATSGGAVAQVQVTVDGDGGDPSVDIYTKNIDTAAASLGQVLVLQDVTTGRVEYGRYQEEAATGNGTVTVQQLPGTINANVGTGVVERAIFSQTPLNAAATATFNLSTISPLLNGDGVPVWYSAKVVGSSIGQAGLNRTSYQGSPVVGSSIEVGPIVNNAGTLQMDVTNNLGFNVELVVVLEYVV